MKQSNFRKIYLFYKLTCIIVTLCIIAFTCFEFYNGSDHSQVQIKTFDQDNQSTFPDVTICFPNHYSEVRLRKYGEGINSSTYAKFLDGDLWDDRMASIPFEEVSMKLSDILLQVCVRSAFEEDCQSTGVYTTMPLGGSSICFTFQMSSMGLSAFGSFSLKIKNSVFKDGIRPTRFINPRTGSTEGMMVWFHRHNQTLGGVGSVFALWPIRKIDSAKSYGMHFQIKALETFEERKNGLWDTCNDSESYDRQRFKGIIEEINCRPMYWTGFKDYPLCTNENDMKKILLYNRGEIFQNSNQTSVVTPPCTTIARVDVEYMDEEILLTKVEQRKNDWFFISIELMTDTSKHIIQVSAISPIFLLGILGGYISFFVGFSVLDIPSYISKTMQKGKQEKFEEESIPIRSNNEHILDNVIQISNCRHCKSVERI